MTVDFRKKSAEDKRKISRGLKAYWNKKGTKKKVATTAGVAAGAAASILALKKGKKLGRKLVSKLDNKIETEVAGAVSNKVKGVKTIPKNPVDKFLNKRYDAVGRGVNKGLKTGVKSNLSNAKTTVVSEGTEGLKDILSTPKRTKDAFKQGYNNPGSDSSLTTKMGKFIAKRIKEDSKRRKDFLGFQKKEDFWLEFETRKAQNIYAFRRTHSAQTRKKISKALDERITTDEEKGVQKKKAARNATIAAAALVGGGALLAAKKGKFKGKKTSRAAVRALPQKASQARVKKNFTDYGGKTPKNRKKGQVMPGLKKDGPNTVLQEPTPGFVKNTEKVKLAEGVKRYSPMDNPKKRTIADTVKAKTTETAKRVKNKAKKTKLKVEKYKPQIDKAGKIANKALRTAQKVSYISNSVIRAKKSFGFEKEKHNSLIDFRRGRAKSAKEKAAIAQGMKEYWESSDRKAEEEEAAKKADSVFLRQKYSPTALGGIPELTKDNVREAREYKEKVTKKVSPYAGVATSVGLYALGKRHLRKNPYSPEAMGMRNFDNTFIDIEEGLSNFLKKKSYEKSLKRFKIESKGLPDYDSRGTKAFRKLNRMTPKQRVAKAGARTAVLDKVLRKTVGGAKNIGRINRTIDAGFRSVGIKDSMSKTVVGAAIPALIAGTVAVRATRRKLQKEKKKK